MPGANVFTKLEYGSRFGEGIAKIANTHSPAEGRAQDLHANAAKYTKWFTGEEAQPEALTIARSKFRKILPTMGVSEIVHATKENLSILGGDAHGMFASRLPSDSKMRKTIRTTVLDNLPYLGSCKFGEVVTPQSDDTYSVMQMFITNFDGDLDTTGGGAFYRPKSREFSQMFFGVNILMDKNGDPLGFDLDKGDRGIAFKTKDIKSAFYNIASASMGLSIEELARRATRLGKS